MRGITRAYPAAALFFALAVTQTSARTPQGASATLSVDGTSAAVGFFGDPLALAVTGSPGNPASCWPTSERDRSRSSVRASRSASHPLSCSFRSAACRRRGRPAFRASIQPSWASTTSRSTCSPASQTLHTTLRQGGVDLVSSFAESAVEAFDLDAEIKASPNSSSARPALSEPPRSRRLSTHWACPTSRT